MTNAARQARYRKGEAYRALRQSDEFKAAQAARCAAWRASPKGQAWLARKRAARAALRARKLAVLKRAGLA